MIAYGKSRNLAIFSIDIDSYDYKTKSGAKVFSNIMRQLRSRRKGIMLFHDIQQSTASAMQRILDTMQREGFKIVHVVSKSPVETLTEFDEQAQLLHSKRRTVARAAAIKGGPFENAPRSRRQRNKAEDDTKVAAAKEQEEATNPFSPPNRTRALAQPRLRPRAEKDWRESIWSN